jgi:4-hydroxy-4-methyl-2-oxoglutarate aldolase
VLRSRDRHAAGPALGSQVGTFPSKETARVHIVRNFERPDRKALEAIAKFPPATLHEAQGRTGALTARIRPIYSGMQACGPSFTAICHPGDNIMLITAISIARAGDVLVVAAGDQPEQGGFGEVLATACKAKGIAVLVTDAGGRDGLAIRKVGLPVFSLGLCVKGTVKERLGTIGQPIVIGGVTVDPGDFVSADDDGVVVVPRANLLAVATASESREAKEAETMAALRAGSNILELSGMNKVLAAKGATYG